MASGGVVLLHAAVSVNGTWVPMRAVEALGASRRNLDLVFEVVLLFCCLLDVNGLRKGDCVSQGKLSCVFGSAWSSETPPRSAFGDEFACYMLSA